MILTAENKDIIVYKLGSVIGTDKDKVIMSSSLNDHYNGEYTNPEDIQAIIINPRKELNKIKESLTKEQKFILDNFCKFI